MIYGQVLSTDNAIGYQSSQIEDTAHNLTRDSLPGEILVRVGATTSNGLTREMHALPLFPNITSIPLVGELVVLVSMPNGLDIDQSSSQLYYISTINVHSDRNLNQLPWLYDVNTKSTTINNINVSSNAKVPEQYSFSEKTVKPLQPFEGDIIYQDRFGSALRFGSTISRSARTPSGKSVYPITPYWIGNKQGDPIVTLTTGVDDNDENALYVIENPKKDKSLIYLTTSQQVNFGTAQGNTGVAGSLSRYDKPQIILSSDRVIINSKNDSILLSAKETVAISTPNWATDMDTFFTMVEDMQTEINNIHNELGQLTSQVANLAAAITTFGSAQATAASAAGVIIPPIVPLAAPPGALAGAMAPVTSGTSTITGQLTNIKTKLGAIDSTLARLKQ